MCYCPAGFFRNLAGECEDLDECELKGFCVGSGSTCENTDGSFECTCASGLVYLAYQIFKKSTQIMQYEFKSNAACEEKKLRDHKTLQVWVVFRKLNF